MDIELGLISPHQYILTDLRKWAGHRIVAQVLPADRQYFLNVGFSISGTAATSSGVYFVMARTLSPEMLGEVRADGRTLSGVADWVQSTKNRMNRPKLSPFQLGPLPETDQNLGELLREYAAVLQEIADIVCMENG